MKKYNRKYKLNDIVIVFGCNRDNFKANDSLGIITGFSQYGSYLVSTAGITGHYCSEEDLQKLDVEPEELKNSIRRLRERNEVTILSSKGVDIFFGVNNIKKVSISNMSDVEIQIPVFDFTINAEPGEITTATLTVPIKTIKNYDKW